MSSLFLTMALLFLIGTQLSWPRKDSHKSIKDNKEVKEDNIKSKSDPMSDFKLRPIDRLNNQFPSIPDSMVKHFKFRDQKLPQEILDELHKNSNLKQKRGKPSPEGTSPLSVNKKWGKPSSEGTFPLSEFTTLEVPSLPEHVSRQDPWKIWSQWVKPDHLYPEDKFYSDEMNHILNTMATAQLTSFGLGYKGTQLKASMMLGKQRTVFKPKRSVAHYYHLEGLV